MSSPTSGGGGDNIGSSADVRILTSGKRRIPAYSRVLAAASPVLKSFLEKAETRSDGGVITISILGVPHEAVGWLKRACERALASHLAAEGVVDVLVLARRCDAAWLHLRCMKLIADDFAAVERTEAWRFLQEHDPCLELDILQSLQDAHLVRLRASLPSFRHLIQRLTSVA
ncbi:hypothetical protein ZIOFF_049557 [Zingiber officinale]|uniref:BTB domain-containing protein n=1 Tax=Zingiber officinale TaxID=94328 RepID=A0A8J5KVB8_ZINOF|nr:hypothetical protein ZIOFF_049557 [Zingiber officinale]